MKVLGALDWLLESAMWAGASLVLVLLFAGPSLIGAKADPEESAAKQGIVYPGTDGGATTSSSASAGPQLFKDNCGSCHTLQAAGTSGTTGPDLDDAAPDRARVISVVDSGSGIMPSFRDQLSEAEIEAIADFVAGP